MSANNDHSRKVKNHLEGIMGIPFTSGNHIETLRNGDEIFSAMLAAIEKATTSIDLATYVYWTGDIAERFANALADRSVAGVKVRLLLDSYGAKAIKKELLELMQDKGITVRWFRPLKSSRFFLLDNRTHRKILIVDNEIGFTGGVGIAEEWEGDARDSNEWRDTHFLFRGPVVAGLNAAFIANWAETGAIDITHEIYTMDHQPMGNAEIQVLRSTSSAGWSDIESLFHALISYSNKSLKISTAYFVCDQAMVDTFLKAKDRGVEIQILLPGDKSDQQFSKIAGEEKFSQLLDAGIQIYEYQKTMLHTKIILVDDIVACIGSPNFNQRSMGKDEEIALCVIEDKALQTLDNHFQDDLKYAEKYDIENWKNRSKWKIFMQNFLSLFKKQL